MFRSRSAGSGSLSDVTLNLIGESDRSGASQRVMSSPKHEGVRCSDVCEMSAFGVNAALRLMPEHE